MVDKRGNYKIRVSCSFLIAMCLTLTTTSTFAIAAEKSDKESYESYNGAEPEPKSWYSWFWPLGEHVEVETLRDEYVPFQTEETHYESVDQVLEEEPNVSAIHWLANLARLCSLTKV